MTLIIPGTDLKERVTAIMENASCNGVTCDTHDGCGEQCNHCYY